MSDLKTKSRLGRGLSSLMSGPVMAEIAMPDVPPAAAPSTPAPSTSAAIAPARPMSGGEPDEIAINQIVPNPHQPRRTINHAAIAELAASLRSTGFIQPIVVRKVAQGYELIAGERRWRAAQQAGMVNIPALVRDVDRFKQAEMALVENIQRENLNPLDRAGGYRAMIDQLGLTQAELAQRLGEDRSTIANHIRLLELPESVRQLIVDGKLQLGHAKLLAGVTDKNQLARLAKVVVSQDLSVRNLERLIQSGNEQVAPARTSNGSAHLHDLEKTLTRHLGLRVHLKASAKKGKGKLVIHYNSLDEFDQLMTSLGVKPEA
jgi:ParB family chromosome partitioning protein